MGFYLRQHVTRSSAVAETARCYESLKVKVWTLAVAPLHELDS